MNKVFMFHALILAGGGGTRLWPVSRKKTPKQVQPFTDNETLLQKTYHRIEKGFAPENIFIATGKQHYDLIKQQLPDISAGQFSLEPLRRDTAAAIGLAVLRIYKKDPDAVIVTINSDAYVKNEAEYLRILELANQTVKKHQDHIVLVGINPTYPETGYGYIKMGKMFKELNGDKIFYVEKFVEKPDLETAKKYLSAWEYLWNPALFVFNAGYFLSLYKKYLLEMYKQFAVIEKSLGTPAEEKIIEQEFEKIKAISVDYGIIEKAENMLVIPADFGWADIGHWRTVKDVLSENEIDNLVKGSHIGVETKGSLIYNFTDKLVATAGVENLIVVVTDDSILICSKNHAQGVKKIVEKLEGEGMEKYL
ncbi:MAG TPA: sugar phosphate nucleotidyltransferase [Patescibacteria group bacterium]|nr:sugar phosphate nucleotidyltransferase [Patescibacteria group bacterium]